METVNPVTKPKRESRRAPVKPLAVTVDETCRLGIGGRTKVYELIAEGKLKTALIGRRRLVIYESIEDLLHQSAA